jgi:hypothetical protein
MLFPGQAEGHLILIFVEFHTFAIKAANPTPLNHVTVFIIIYLEKYTCCVDLTTDGARVFKLSAVSEMAEPGEFNARQPFPPERSYAWR